VVDEVVGIERLLNAYEREGQPRSDII